MHAQLYASYFTHVYISASHIDRQGVVSSADRLKALDGEQYIIVDYPVPLVHRITLNRPDKRNALRSELQTQL